MTDDAAGTAARLAAAGRTHVGRVRPGNEDAHLARPGAGLLVVADGMGGHAAGEVASALAVEALDELLAGGGWTGTGEARRAVEEAVEAANRRVRRDARENASRRGMGTTVTVLLLPDPRTWVAGHVGDSRAYRLRDGELSRLTTDHTVAPGSSTLTRALGSRDSVEVDVLDGEARAGDVFLLCSDGLTDMLVDEEIRDVLAGAVAGEPGPGEAVEEAAAALVQEALDRGGRDNVTVVVAAVT